MERDDRALVRSFVDGDGDSFRELYLRHAPLVYAFVTRMVGSSDADDVLQETWIRAARGVCRFEWRSSLRTWLCGIASNCSRERLRERGRLSDDDITVAEAAESVPWYDATALQIDLERAISRLSPRYREVFLLHDVAALTHVEIAELLAIETGTSKSNLARARGALRELLDQCPSDQASRRIHE